MGAMRGLYKGILVPTLLSGSEALRWYLCDKSRRVVLGMDFLGRVFGIRRNYWIRRDVVQNLWVAEKTWVRE